MDILPYLKKIALFKSLAEEDLVYIWKHSLIKHYDENDVIINEGDLANALYIITNGSLQVFTIVDNQTLILARLNEGDFFGEQAYFNNFIRTASVKALTHAELITISYEILDFIYKKSDAIRLILDKNQITRITSNLELHLENLDFVLHKHTAHIIAGLKAKVLQYKEKYHGLMVIFTQYIFSNEKIVVCAKVLDQPIFIMNVKNITPDRSVQFKRGELIFRKVSFKNHHIISITATGKWDDLNILCTMLLKNIEAPPITPESFSKNGNLLQISSNFEFYASDIICNCMNVSYETIKDAVAKGCNDLRQISEATGACTACCSCQNNILDILGKSDWTFATITEHHKFTDKVNSYIIKPLHSRFNNFNAGQYILIKLQIDNLWFERAYTLTSLESNLNSYEIMVKYREQGAFSPWLFAHAKNSLFTWISHPRGNFILTAKTAETVFCFANGIGITPFISYIRNLKNLNIQIYIYYSVENNNNIYLPTDVHDLINNNPNIYLEIWDYSIKNEMNNKFIANEIKKYNPSSIYVCGSKIFENKICQQLNEIGFDSKKVFTEVFLPSG